MGKTNEFNSKILFSKCQECHVLIMKYCCKNSVDIYQHHAVPHWASDLGLLYQVFTYTFLPYDKISVQQPL